MRAFFIIFLSFLVFHVPKGFSNKWQWSISLGDTSGATYVNALCGHTGDNFLAAGNFDSKSLHLADKEINNAGRKDIFVAAFDRSGNPLWSRGFGGASDDVATAIVSDKEGNIYMAGNFSSLSLNFDMFTLINKGENDGFLIKLDKEKVVQWALGFGGNTDDYITGLVADGEGSVYLAGYSVDYNKNEGKLFTARVNPDMGIAWQRYASTGAYGIKVGGIALDDQNNCYMAGSFNTEITFDSNDKLATSEWAGAAFTVKYSNSGNYIKSSKINGFSNPGGIIYSDGSLFISGDSINYGFGWGWPLADSKIYLSRLDLDLQQQWLRETGGIEDFQSLDIVKSISADYAGNIYLTGSFFSPGFTFGSNLMGNVFNKDYYYEQAFILKYSPEGNEIWGKAIGDSLCDGGRSILAVGDDRFIVAGYYESLTISINPHILQNNSSISSLYVHLRPRRYARNAFSFLANFSDLALDGPIHGYLKLSVYPNPANDYLHVQLEKPVTGIGYLELYAADGRRVQNQVVMPGQSLIQFNTSGLNSGIFLLKANIDQLESTYKIIRE